MSDVFCFFSMLLAFGFSMRTLYVSSYCHTLPEVTHRLLKYSSKPSRFFLRTSWVPCSLFLVQYSIQTIIRVRRTRQRGIQCTSHSQSPTLKVEARTFGKHDATLPSRKHTFQLADAVGSDNGNIGCYVNSDDSRLAQNGEGHVRYTPWLVGNVKLAVDGCTGVEATKALVVHVTRSRAGLFRYTVNNGHCGPFSDDNRSLFPHGVPPKCESVSTKGSNRPNSQSWPRLAVWTVGALVVGILSKTKV